MIIGPNITKRILIILGCYILFTIIQMGVAYSTIGAEFFSIYLSAFSRMIPIFVIFIVVLLGVQKYANKGFKKFRNNINQKRQIVCEGPAKLTGTQGYMFLSDDALEFYGTNRFGTERRDFAILPDDFISVDVQEKNLCVETREQTFLFKVYKAEEWKQQISAVMLK